MMTCTECGNEVRYDEETKLHHCGPCIRVGERVSWCGQSFLQGRLLRGTVVAYDLGQFDGERVKVVWDHRGRGSDAVIEAREYLRHLNVLDLLAEI